MSNKKDYNKLFRKGQRFETVLAVRNLFARDNGVHLMGVRVVTKNGEHTVIDNLSVYGKTIFIIEAKNYKILEGNSTDKLWRGKGTGAYFRLLNPLTQNKYHLSQLKQLLGEKGHSIYSYDFHHYIVVPDDCQLLVDDEAMKHILTQRQYTLLMSKVSRTNTSKDLELLKVLKECL